MYQQHNWNCYHVNRDQQSKFNQKFRSLSPELQRFSANQFNQLQDDILEHAFNMFLTLDADTLAQVGILYV